MARPPLAMDTHGSITIKKRATSAASKQSNGTARADSYVARCRFRDYDGVTRSLERSGPSKTAASRSLQDEIRARTGSPAAPLRPHHTFERAAERWLAKLDAQLADGSRKVTTADTYRQRLRSVILPAIGQWRLRECTVPQLDGFFAGLAATQSAQSRKTIRTVVSLILRVAVQHEVIPDNPVRHLDPSEGDLFVPKQSGRGPVLRVLAGRRRSVRPWSFAELWARIARLSRSWSLTSRVRSPRRGSHPHDLATPERAAARVRPSAQPLADSWSSHPGRHVLASRRARSGSTPGRGR